MDQVQKFLLKLFRQVGSTKAQRFARYVENGEWGLLQEQTMSDPSVYGNATLYKKDALITEIARKLLLPGDNVKRKLNTIELFWHSERQCALTNSRLSRFIGNQGPFGPADERLIAFIGRWRKELKRALGRAPWMLTPRFNPGATLTHAGKLLTIPDKMSEEPSAYAHSLNFVRPYFVGTVLDTTPKIFRGNEFFTVPKDSQKDRGCGKEASLNVMLQLDVGRKMKTLYEKAYQANLRRMKPVHRKLAQLASETGNMATIDLSNASDTIARNLIKLLLPDDWWELLNSLRAHHTLVDDKSVFLEKFSSMGNGFTFELETFIFRSLLSTLGCKIAYVFGDDIIVETERARDVISALKFFGFTPNEKKTFCEGPFRESCGGDYFLGEPVRAHYLKSVPDDPQKWVALANGLRRADPHLRWVGAARRFAIDQIPSHLRCYGPEGLGDLVIFDPDAKPCRKLINVGCAYEPRKEERIVWKILKPVTRKLSLTEYWSPRIALAAAAYGTGPDIAYRGNVTGFRISYVLSYGINDPMT